MLIELSFLSSHSSVVPLFFRRRVGCLYPLCITCVRCAEYTGIVADEHHSQECTGNLA